MTELRAPHTVTFDCWQTLIYEARPAGGQPLQNRVKLVQEWTGCEPEPIAAAFTAAWLEHQRAWHGKRVFAGSHMTEHVLRALGVTLSAERQAELLRALEDQIASHDIIAIDGARELLESLRALGVRVALICDTGFTPGRVVRQLLERVGLLQYLEVQIFSDEVGAPKPHPRAFRAALEGLGVEAAGAVHVGDLRRSDVAGARASGMRSVRFRGRNDDTDEVGQNAGVVDCRDVGCEPVCERPEADFVASSYAELGDYLRAH